LAKPTVQEAKVALANEFKTAAAKHDFESLRYEVKDRENNLVYVIEVTAHTPEDLQAGSLDGVGYTQGIGS